MRCKRTFRDLSVRSGLVVDDSYTNRFPELTLRRQIAKRPDWLKHYRIGTENLPECKATKMVDK